MNSNQPMRSACAAVCAAFDAGHLTPTSNRWVTIEHAAACPGADATAPCTCDAVIHVIGNGEVLTLDHNGQVTSRGAIQ